MGIFSRLSDIVNSNINAMLDRAEDPAKIIRLIIQEMEDTLVEVRSAAVRTIAEKKEIQRRIARLAQEVEEWEGKAELALSKGREDLARGALLAKARTTEAKETLERQLVHLTESLDKTNADIAQLQAKLDDAKKREKTIVERQKSATHRLKVREKLYDERITDAFARFEQVERNLDQMEGKVEAFDLGRGKILSEQFAKLEAEGEVEQELAELKRRMAARGSGQPLQE